MLFDDIKAAREFAIALAKATGKPVGPRTFRSGGKSWYAFGKIFGQTKFDSTWEYQGSTAEDRRATLDFNTTWGTDDLPEDFWEAEESVEQAVKAYARRFCRWEPVRRTVQLSSLGAALYVARKHSRPEAKARVTRKVVQEPSIIYGGSEYDIFTEYIEGYYTRRVYEVTYTWRRPLWEDAPTTEEEYELVQLDEEEIPQEEEQGYEPEQAWSLDLEYDERKERRVNARVAASRARSACATLQWRMTTEAYADNQARLRRQTEFTRLLSKNPQEAMAWWRQQPADVRKQLLDEVKAL